MPPTESQEVQTASPNKNFLKIGAVAIVALLLLVVALRYIAPPKTQEGSTSTIPLSDEQRVVLEARIKNDTLPPPLSQEQTTVLEERIKDNTPAPPLSDDQRAILEARINTQNAQ